MSLRTPGRVLRALAVTVAASVTMLGLAAVPAQAAVHTMSVTSYAALGDSYSSGVGTNNYYAGGCSRSPQSYAVLWSNAHGVTNFNFAACGGATTTDVLNNQLGGLSASTQLVTITIGGNDAGFATVVGTCRLTTDTLCDIAVGAASVYASTVLPGKLDATYAAIRAHAPNAQLLVLGYPRLFELSSSCGFLGMSLHKRTTLNNGANTIDSVIAGRAAAAGATFVDARGTFAGHGICASSAWINDVTWPITDSYHPKASGYLYGYLPALTAVTG